MFVGVAPLHMTDVFLMGEELEGWEERKPVSGKHRGLRFGEEGAEHDS